MAEHVAVAEKGGISRRGFLKLAGGVAGVAAVGLPMVKHALAQSPFFVTLPKETILDMYRRMQRIRMAGGAEGEEAAHVGVIMAMNKGDFLGTTHNCVPDLLGRGVETKYFLAEKALKATGISHGRWGSYLSIWDPDKDLLVLGSGIVAAAISQGVGLAKAAKLRGTKQVAVTVCGDGAMNETGFNTSINLAAIWELPVVFHVVNNHWENEATIEKTQSLTRAGLDLAARAAGYGIPGFTVDGMDVFAVYKAAKHCVDRARDGNGPSLLETVCYDYGRGEAVGKWPHNRPGELEYWKARDPITRFESTVLAGGSLLTQAELDSVRKAVETEVKEAKDFADKSPAPDPKTDDYLQYISKVFGA